MSNCSHPIGDFHLMIFQFAGILGVKDSLLNELTKLYEQNKTRLQVWFEIQCFRLEQDVQTETESHHPGKTKEKQIKCSCPWMAEIKSGHVIDIIGLPEQHSTEESEEEEQDY